MFCAVISIGEHIASGERNAAEVWHSSLHSKPRSRHLSRHEPAAHESIRWCYTQTFRRHQLAYVTEVI